MVVKMSALRADRPLPPGRFLVLISDGGWVDPKAIVLPERLGKLEKSNDLIGNRTRDPSDCSIVSKPTTLPRAPLKTSFHNKFCLNHLWGYVTLSVSNFIRKKSPVHSMRSRTWHSYRSSLIPIFKKLMTHSYWNDVHEDDDLPTETFQTENNKCTELLNWITADFHSWQKPIQKLLKSVVVPIGHLIPAVCRV
jgi:hypothetical protein